SAWCPVGTLRGKKRPVIDVAVIRGETLARVYCDPGLTTVCDDVILSVIHGSDPFTSEGRTDSARGSLQTLRTLRASGALRAYRPLRTRGAGGSHRPLRTRGAAGSDWPS